MKVGPACYQIAPSRSISVTGPLFPWQNCFQIAKQQQVNAPGIAQVVRSDVETGERLFTMEPLPEVTWMELDIRPAGTVFFDEGDEVTVDDIASANPILNFWAPIKVRVSYQALGSEIRHFDCDVGVGSTIPVPPTNRVDVDLLVPCEDGIDEIIASGAAPPVPAAQLRNRRFATTVSCKATVVHSPNPVARPKYTNLYYLDPGQDAGSVGAQAKLQEYTGRVQIIAGRWPPAGLPLTPGDTEAFYRVEPVELPQGVSPEPPPLPFGIFPIPFTTNGNLSERADVPRPFANVVRVRTGTRIQNAIVSQELFI